MKVLGFEAAERARLTDEQAGRYGRYLLDKYGDNGHPTPDSVLADARSVSSPLHDFFDWDDAVAAQRWRHDQAAYLLRNIRIVYETPDGPRGIRLFLRIEEPETRTATYYFAARVAEDPELSARHREQLVQRLKALRTELDRFDDFIPIAQAIDLVLGN